MTVNTLEPRSPETRRRDIDCQLSHPYIVTAGAPTSPLQPWGSTWLSAGKTQGKNRGTERAIMVEKGQKTSGSLRRRQGYEEGLWRHWSSPERRS